MRVLRRWWAGVRGFVDFWTDPYGWGLMDRRTPPLGPISARPIKIRIASMQRGELPAPPCVCHGLTEEAPAFMHAATCPYWHL